VQCLKAEDFEKKAYGMLDWLTEAERHLRYQGTMPDSEEVLEQQLADHQVTSLLNAAVFLSARQVLDLTNAVVCRNPTELNNELILCSVCYTP